MPLKIYFAISIIYLDLWLYLVLIKEMGIFSKKSAIPINGPTSPLFMPVSFILDFLSGSLTANEQKYFNYYLQIPELQAIINYRAKCKSSMIVKARNIKSGEDVESPFVKLLQQPNVLQSFQEWMRQLSIYQDIFGNAYIYTLYGTKIENTQALWLVPPIDAKIITPKDINIFTATKYSEIIKGYEFMYNGGKISFGPEEIIHLYDSWVYGKDKLTFKGESKIRPLTQALENIKTSYEARGIILGNSPLGMITNDSTDGVGTSPLSPKDKIEVQEAMRMYGVSKDKYSYLISAAKLKWQSMSVNVTEQHFKEVEQDMRAISNAYSFPPDLVMGNNTYENVKQSEKRLYQDSIIPESQDTLQGLSSAFGMIDQGVELYADFNHIASLQTDYETKSRTYNTMVMAFSKALADGAINNDEYRAGLEKIGMI